MDLTQIAAKLFLEKIGAGNLDLSSVISGLKQLLPTSGSDLDVAGLVTKFASQGGGVESLVSSWLGDGGNKSISANGILDILGDGKVSQFADTLGLTKEKAAGGLSDMIPDLIDKGSEGGSLVQDISASLGKKLLSSLF